MSQLFARKALLQDGWSDNVRLTIRAGRIEAIETGVARDDREPALGILIPGLGNGHSHAFQRALAGRTEQRSPAHRDTFWTWREKMYELAARVDPEALTAIFAEWRRVLAAGGEARVYPSPRWTERDTDRILGGEHDAGFSVEQRFLGSPDVVNLPPAYVTRFRRRSDAR